VKKMTRPLVLISGSLAGIRCSYDGKVLTDLFIQKIVSKGEGIVVCPEQLD
jgi:uncharacterized protein YbbK (DUF523 family)